MSTGEVERILARLDDFERRVIVGLEERIRSLELWRSALAGAVATLSVLTSIVGLVLMLKSLSG